MRAFSSLLFSLPRPSAAVLALALTLTCAGALQAAETPRGERSVPGTVVPGSGTTGPVDASASAPRRPAPPAGSRPVPAAGAGSLSGSTAGEQAADCVALRREYARSQACFAPYRLANGGMKPEAYKRCKPIENPSVQCGTAPAK